MELLAPVKNKESAFLAVNLKAQALYCSGPLYSARHNAGLSFVDLAEVIEYAHLYEVKVYLTLNTLIFEQDFMKVIDYVNQVVALNIDALIVQDLGLMSVLKQCYPSLELHGSTQMHIHNKAGVQFISDYLKRIVLARELNLMQITEVKEAFPLVEIETFIHGALCTSYSGQCFYSAFYQTGSGNLGTCQQNCRKLHRLQSTKEEHLLSLKDLKVGSDIESLKGITDSLKIEGRLKGLDYLYSTVSYYQAQLRGNDNVVMADLMQVAFNRQYTKGRLFNENGQTLANPKRINNHGLLIGAVVKANVKYLTIQVNKTLTRLDNIRIVANNQETGMVIDKIFQNNQEVNQVSNGLVKIVNKARKVIKGDVYLVKTRRYDDEIKKMQTKYLNKITLSADIEVRVGNKMKCIIKQQEYLSDFIVEQACKQVMNLDDIVKQFSKTNDTAFNFKINIRGDDNLFIAKSQLNEFRRTIITDQQAQRLSRSTLMRYPFKQIQLEKSEFKGYKFQIKTLAQARALAGAKIAEVYVDNLELLDALVPLFDSVIPVLPRVIKDDYFDECLEKIAPYSHVMVSEVGMLERLKNEKIIETNFSFNVTNSATAQLLKDNRVINAQLSPELNDKLFKIAGLMTSQIVYGHQPLMIMDYCPINKEKIDNCGLCRLCQEKQHYLYDEKKRKLPLIYAQNDTIELYSHQPLNIIGRTDANYAFICFTIEDYKQTIQIIKKVRREFDEKIF